MTEDEILKKVLADLIITHGVASILEATAQFCIESANRSVGNMSKAYLQQALAIGETKQFLKIGSFGTTPTVFPPDVLKQLRGRLAEEFG